MAVVSVRTLHHYDHIDLLKPSSRSGAGYQLYGEKDLLRLQQVLFFKELDLPLSDIRTILDDPGFDQVAALESHRRLLERRVERLTHLLKTIDRTIMRLTEDDTTMKMTDEELYEGFTKEEAERYTREAQELYDPELVRISQERIAKMSREQWRALRGEGGEITQAIAGLADRSPVDPEVQRLIARHHAWIERFYPCSAEVYRGLGQGYAEHEGFRAYYDKYRPNLADFMQAAMTHYADHSLT